jgi:putative ABC transport system permease protein
MPRADDVFRALLRLFPQRFRDRYGDEMLEVWRADHARGDVRWVRAALDLIASAARTHASELQRSRSALHTTHRTLESPRGDSMIATLLQDLRYAIRGMVSRPAFAVIVLATLALGIGANTAIFSVVNGILFRPLPYRDADRIVRFTHAQPNQTVSEPEFRDYKRDMRAFEMLAAFNQGELSLSGGEGDPMRVQSTRVSSEFFPILGVHPALGRTFAPDEFKTSGPRAIILSHGLWMSQFGGDSSIVGKDVLLNGQPRSVIGVMPKGFDFPTAAPGIWTAWRVNYDSLWTRNNHYLTLVGRLAPGKSIEMARTEANTLGKRWLTDFPETYKAGEPLVADIESIGTSITGATRPFLLALFGAVGFVLLIACVNVANLFLTRGESRRKEFVIRSALGASGGRLISQLLIEGLLFAMVGGLLGVSLAFAIVRLLVRAAPPSLPRVGDIHIDGTVLVFTLAITILTGLVFGLIPGFRSAGAGRMDAQREGGKTSAHRSSATLRRLLVASETALAVVMLAGAGIMLRSLWSLQGTELGFEPAGVLTAQLALPPAQYPQDRTVSFYERAVAGLASSPGVVAAAAVQALPIADGGSRYSVMIDNVVLRNISESPSPAPQQITPDYFRVMGMGMAAGRAFTAEDRLGAPFVAIVNEALARELWKGVSPIGHTIKMFNDAAPWATIVGVVKDARVEGITEPVPPMMFFPHAQATRSNYSASQTMSLVVRTQGRPETVAPVLRDVVRKLEPAVPVARLRSMEDVVASSIDSRRFSTALLAGFAALALILAGIGIYGVIAFSVSQRTYEIGLRVALGAQRGSVATLVLRQVLAMTGAGAVVGLIGAVAVTRAAKSLIVGVSAFDIPTLLAAAGLIAVVALVACSVPVRRALAINPTEALRSD